MRIGHKIKKIRELKNFTQEEMASKLNITQSNYSKMERDEIDINMSRLEDISKVLQIDLNELINFDEQNVFLFHNNKAVSGINGTVNNHYNNTLTDRERTLYEDKVFLLEEKIRFQEEKIKMLEAQLKMLQGTHYISVNEDLPTSGARKKRPVVK